MVAIYVLKLVRGKYYVGLTTKNIDRVLAHLDGKGAKWTKKYPPSNSKPILRFEEGLKESDENRITLETMAKYGVKNVRGGDWCKVRMSKKEIDALQELVNKKFKKRGSKSKSKTKSKTKSKGYCIRCRDSKTYDFEKPMCLDCYRDWQYEPEGFYEDYCHCCGKLADTLLEKPLCISCWKKK